MSDTQNDGFSKILPLTPQLCDYAIAHGTPPDEVLAELTRRTHALGDIARMQISAEQGAFLWWLVRALEPKLAVEIGTFTGYSAIWIARGLPAGGRLLCCDISREWTDVAREFWERAGVSDRIELVLAPATETLAGLDAGADSGAGSGAGSGAQVDFAFIDADKGSYVEYYEALVPRLSRKGVIAVDNVLWSGRVIDAEDVSPDTQALRDFNSHVAADPRVSQVVLPIADGLTLISLA